jgi:REP element-mobilizing transposase RayT
MNFQVLEFNGEADHIHELVEYPPKLSISQIVNTKEFRVIVMGSLETKNSIKKQSLMES